MKILQWVAIAGLTLGISACGGAPEGDAKADAVPPRNVVVKQIVPQKLDIQITLPVLVNPTETIELRAAMPGLIVDLPYSEGDVIPASAIPTENWTDLKEYLEINIDGSNTISDEELSLRNMQYLTGAPSFAKIDNKQLIQSLTESQVAYDSAVRNLDRAKQYSASTQAQLDAAGVARVQTRAGVNRVLGMLEDTLICNPRQGVLTKRYRQKGEFVGAGELLGTVAVIDTLKVTVQVPEAHQKALKKGDEVSIWL
ncbi:MAG: HlyD family efflux transporter periplasmic adaptor subunit, partial [Planctomycetota bacterium]